MTRKEFSAKSEALRRIGAWCIAGLIISIFGLLAGEWTLSSYIREHYHAKGWDTSVGIMELIWMFGCLIGLSFLEWRLAGKWGLACPKCGKRFIDKMRRRVLLTGKCPKCKAEVFEDGVLSARLTSRPLNREEFKLEFEIVMRRSNRKSIQLLIFLAAALCVVVPLAKYIQRSVDNGALDWITLTQWRWFAVVMLASVFLAYFSVFVFAAMGKFKLRDLPCPECNHSLVGVPGKLAIETGMCIYCGCRLFKDMASEKASRFMSDPH